MTTELLLALWRECEYCKGNGGSDLFDRHGVQLPCRHCNGWGMRPIKFIPLEELCESLGAIPHMVTAINRWLEKKAKEADNVPDGPPSSCFTSGF